MTDHLPSARALAKEFFENNSITPDEQTRITLFVQAVKGINAAILSKVEFQSMDWLPYKHLHGQYFKEMELATLLGRATRWSRNPQVLMRATSLNLVLWRETNAAIYIGSFFNADRSFYQYLALSHAFMSQIRFIPLLPTHLPLDTPFLSALKDIEEENGRQIQAQIRLLKDMPSDLAVEEKQEIITRQKNIVDGVYCRLLMELTDSRDDMINPPVKT